MTTDLDQFAREILDIVQLDCHLKAEVIAERVGLSASAVQRRLKRLRKDRVISSEIAVVDRRIAGNSMCFITGMEIDRESYDALSRFRIWADKQAHIQQVYHVTGSVDLIAVITSRDLAHYEEITAQILSQNPQITRMHTNVVLKDMKLGMFVPVE